MAARKKKRRLPRGIGPNQIFDGDVRGGPASGPSRRGSSALGARSETDIERRRRLGLQTKPVRKRRASPGEVRRRKKKKRTRS